MHSLRHLETLRESKQRSIQSTRNELLPDSQFYTRVGGGEAVGIEVRGVSRGKEERWS